MAKRQYTIRRDTTLLGKLVFDDDTGIVYISEEDAALYVLLSGIPTEDPADDGVTIWNDGGVLKVSGSSG